MVKLVSQLSVDEKKSAVVTLKPENKTYQIGSAVFVLLGVASSILAWLVLFDLQHEMI